MQSKDGGEVVGKHITDPSNLVKDLEACLKVVNTIVFLYS